jgi:hypothetical protein
MKLIDEIVEDIGRRAECRADSASEVKKNSTPCKRGKTMTAKEKAEYIRRMQEKEEREQLAQMGVAPAKKTAGSKKAKPVKAASRKARKSSRRRMKVLRIMKIPGLPRGDRIAICYVNGAGK